MQSQGQDLIPESSGTLVVQETIAKISGSNIFPDDHQFLRRIAWVESKDGTHPNTYREGYHGGIWQVDLIGFRDTQDKDSHPGLDSKFRKIKSNFGIDWPSVQWEDLRKPLFSALAARLKLSNVPASIPSDLEGQASYWKKYYNSSEGAGDAPKFIKDVNAMP